MITSKLTKRSQTTIPRQVRNALHLKPGQSLVYDIEADRVVMRAHPGALASYGALKGKGKQAPMDFGEARQIAREEWVENVAEEGLDA
jgi:bifunctional DNA-binding transcriptional regulator/antitoxin component of YhaV-PrlF toxin-antitoxin module